MSNQKRFRRFLGLMSMIPCLLIAAPGQAQQASQDLIEQLRVLDAEARPVECEILTDKKGESSSAQQSLDDIKRQEEDQISWARDSLSPSDTEGIAQVALAEFLFQFRNKYGQPFGKYNPARVCLENRYRNCVDIVHHQVLFDLAQADNEKQYRNSLNDFRIGMECATMRDVWALDTALAWAYNQTVKSFPKIFRVQAERQLIDVWSNVFMNVRDKTEWLGRTPLFHLLSAKKGLILETIKDGTNAISKYGLYLELPVGALAKVGPLVEVTPIYKKEAEAPVAKFFSFSKKDTGSKNEIVKDGEGKQGKGLSMSQLLDGITDPTKLGMATCTHMEMAINCEKAKGCYCGRDFCDEEAMAAAEIKGEKTPYGEDMEKMRERFCGIGRAKVGEMFAARGISGMGGIGSVRNCMTDSQVQKAMSQRKATVLECMSEKLGKGPRAGLGQRNVFDLTYTYRNHDECMNPLGLGKRKVFSGFPEEGAMYTKGGVRVIVGPRHSDGTQNVFMTDLKTGKTDMVVVDKKGDVVKPKDKPKKPEKKVEKKPEPKEPEKKKPETEEERKKREAEEAKKKAEAAKNCPPDAGNCDECSPNDAASRATRECNPIAFGLDRRADKGGVEEGQLRGDFGRIDPSPDDPQDPGSMVQLCMQRAQEKKRQEKQNAEECGQVECADDDAQPALVNGVCVCQIPGGGGPGAECGQIVECPDGKQLSDDGCFCEDIVPHDDELPDNPNAPSPVGPRGGGGAPEPPPQP